MQTIKAIRIEDNKAILINKHMIMFVEEYENGPKLNIGSLIHLNDGTKIAVQESIHTIDSQINEE